MNLILILLKTIGKKSRLHGHAQKNGLFHVIQIKQLHYLLHDGGSYHIENSPLICTALVSL